MRKIEIIPYPHLKGTPRCPKCGEPTWLVSIEPNKSDRDRRTFECPRCQEVIVEMIKYK